jgi:hypothetical protein
VQAVGGSRGRISAAAALPDGGRYVLLQGRARPGRSLSPALAGSGSPIALTRAYLGDAAIAAVTSAPEIAVRVERYFASSFAPLASVRITDAPVSALTATMDYRSDVLLAWEQGGSIYAHMVRASGRTDPTQLLGASASHPLLRALVSDNDHGMVAWSSTVATAGDGAHTYVYIDISGPGVRFSAPRLVASFDDPSRAGQGAGSLQLVRLATENVLLAWTTREHGHYVVRAAPAVYAATRPSAVLSDAHGSQSVLGDLAAGPAGEAIAVWRASRGSAFEPQRLQLWSARINIARHDRPRAQAAKLLSRAGPNISPSVGVDPADDRPTAAWIAGNRLMYVTTAGAHRYHSRAASASLAPPGTGTHWLRITLAAVAGAALILAAAAAVVLRRRRVSR